MEDGVKFCPGCGAAVQAAQPQAQPEQNTFAAKLNGINNTADSTAAFDSADIEQNKWMALLAYLGPLVFVPMFVQKDSKFTRYHVNQGLTLFIANAAYAVVQIILTVILRMIFPWKWTYGLWGGRGGVYDTITLILGLVWIVFSIHSVLGIVNVVTGKAKELPVIGKFKFLK